MNVFTGKIPDKIDNGTQKYTTNSKENQDVNIA